MKNLGSLWILWRSFRNWGILGLSWYEGKFVAKLKWEIIGQSIKGFCFVGMHRIGVFIKFAIGELWEWTLKLSLSCFSSWVWVNHEWSKLFMSEACVVIIFNPGNIRFEVRDYDLVKDGVYTMVRGKSWTLLWVCHCSFPPKLSY